MNKQNGSCAMDLLAIFGVWKLADIIYNLIKNGF